MLNHLSFQGRLVDAPAFGQTGSGVEYANFRLAWSEKYKDRETKCFLDCKTFGGTAQFMGKFFRDKGQEMLAEGKLTTEEWEKDGQKRSKIVLIVNNVHFCGKKQEGGAAQADPTANMTPVEMSTDDLPF